MKAVEINAGAAQEKLDALTNTLGNPRLLFQAIAGVLGSETESNFEAQGRPSWVPLSASTVTARLKRNKGSSVMQILQDHGILAKSISTEYGDDFALVGAGGAAKDYAAIHQFGGTISRAPYSTKVRLRTDSKGKLLRQGDNKLAVFAKDSHKRARESWHEVGAYTIKIPARPYLPFKGSDAGMLQPETERKVLDLVVAMLGES